MSRRAEIGILVALMLVLGTVLYRNFRPDASADSDGPALVAVQPLRVPNPALHLDQLARIRQLAYTGSHRNIFSATALPPPAPVVAREEVRTAAPRSGPTGPAPLQVPLQFYGMATDPKTGNKLAFFTDKSKENVYIASQGETLLGHFRLLEIGQNTVKFVDTSTAQTVTLVMTPLATP